MFVADFAPIANHKQPNFYPVNEQRTGSTLKDGFLILKKDYTITFDLMRKCRTCNIDHNIFPADNVGVLLIRDCYTPPVFGDSGKCVPVLRINNSDFEEIAACLRYLMRSRVDDDDKPLAQPRFIIISLPSYLGEVGVEKYVEEFGYFSKWVKLFLSDGVDKNPRDSRVKKFYSGDIEVFEGFALYGVEGRGLEISYGVLNRSMRILKATLPQNRSGILYNVHEDVIKRFCNTPPPTQSLIRYIPIPPINAEFVVYENGVIYLGVSQIHTKETNLSAEVRMMFLAKLSSNLRDIYLGADLGKYLDTLPHPEHFNLETMHKYETRILFENLTPNPTRRVIVIGNLNMNRLSDDLKVCVNEDVQYIPNKLKLTSITEEITSFIKSLELLKSNTVVFGRMSNFLLQGTIQERYARVRLSGVPAGHEMEKQKRTNIHHLSLIHI